MDASASLLELRAVCKRYGTGAAAVDVLSGVDLTLEAGASLAVLGPSGCGKSTLLNCIGTLDRPTSGEVLLEGADWQRLAPREIARLRARRIGFVFQLHHLLPQCTVWENVLLPTLADPSAPPGPEAAERAARLLERVGLSARKNHRPGELSGGERQRAAVVRALINRPALLLADEPTGSLDAASAESLGDLLAGLNREEGVTLVVATHSAELARRMARTGRFEAGRLVLS
ncbi:MAG: ABC transporter ATP-binding protein [Chthoniobacteraceae bacterium]|nr:ABC transporter ATP-binding protein [Chthoniobacteraceae bacterium]